MKKLIVMLTLAISVGLVGCSEDTKINATNGLETAAEELAAPLLQPEVIEETEVTEEVTETVEQEQVSTLEETEQVIPNKQPTGVIIEGTTETVETVEETEQVIKQEFNTEDVTAESIITNAIEISPDNYVFDTVVGANAQGLEMSMQVTMSYDDKIVHEKVNAQMGFPMVFESWYDFENNVGYTNAMGSWMPATPEGYSNAPKTVLEAVSNPELVELNDLNQYVIKCDLGAINIGESLSQEACKAILNIDKTTGYLMSIEYELDEEALIATGVEEYKAFSEFTQYNEVSLEIPQEVQGE